MIDLLQQIERTLESLICEKEEPLSSQLFSAARHSLFSPCKRLRPLLTLTTALALGSSIERAMPSACAIELIHTYSLIHDDLPCMDDDDFRRGKPSLHKVYGEGIALLTGNFLLTLAFETVSRSKLPIKQKVDLMTILSQRIGNQGMIGGQALDLAATDSELLSLNALHQMHLRKTAALIAAALECGGIVAKATASQQLLLKNIGRSVGLAFQVLDDIADFSEKKEEHKNIAALMGIEPAQIYAGELKAQALIDLEALSPQSPLLQELILRSI